MSRRKVAYYYDTEVGAYTYGLGHPMKPHRIRVTHDLVSAYGMLDRMHVLRPRRATPEKMSAFHTDEYVHFLTQVTPETAEKLTYQGTRFLVGEDNPAFEGVFEFCSISAGGSLGAAQRLACGAADIAINWAGGLHHAKKREASGFCYINDIVLGILELLRTYPRVLYIDIDCHHGDGVEEAFYTTDRVMTCSFHKFGEYFPGTGTQEDRGRGKGKGYAVNVPLKDGITDESFKSVFEPIISKILEVFRPSAVVLQCGADSLAGDKLGCFNLTMHGHASCVQFLRKHNVPLILLGGGGYTVKNVARTWTYETACALGIENDIDPNLPWNEYFEWFGPRYRLEVAENNMEDLNMKEGSLDVVRTTALEQLQDLAHAPSVQMTDVPRESVGRHLGFGKDDGRSRDELDDQLAQHTRYLYNLQETETTDDESDAENPDSSSSADESSSSNWRNAAPNSKFKRSNSATRSNSNNGTLNNGYQYPPNPIPTLNNHSLTSSGSGFINSSSTSSQNKRRMSLITGKYYDIPSTEPGYEHFECGGGQGGPASVPNGKNSVRRRFFQSAYGYGGDDDASTVDGIVGMHTSMKMRGYRRAGDGLVYVNGGSGSASAGVNGSVDVEGDGDEEEEDEGEEGEDDEEMVVDS